MSKEALKLVSIKVMEKWAKEYIKIWVAYGPFFIIEKSLYSFPSGVVISTKDL
jgi:hypothetical protein